MKNTKKYIISFLIYFLILFIFPIYKGETANIAFSPSTGSYNVGDTINVKVYIGTDSKSVNAIASNIKYPKETLSLLSISKTGSIINLWAQEPSFSNGEGVASFEGVMLNGYIGNSGNAVTLVFKAKAEGEARISFNSASVLANDGNGTEVLYSKGESILTIKNKGINIIPKPEVVSTEKSTLNTTISISEIKNNTSNYSPNKFLITSPRSVSNNSYSIQIDSMNTIIWTDDGTHIFQAPALSNGLHTIKVMAVDNNSNSLSGFLNFSTTVLKTPVITYIPKNLYVDDLLVLKGIADPIVDIEITITNTKTGGISISHVQTNSDGKFTYVPETFTPAGTYSIVARSTSLNGINSDYMDSVSLVSKERGFAFFILKINNYLLMFIPFISLLILLIIIIIYGRYRLKKFHITLRNKLSKTEDVVSGGFDILDEDMVKEIEVIKKMKSGGALDKESQAILNKFKKDIKEAEKDIEKELKDIEKSNNR